MLGYRLRALLTAQVHHVEMIAAELAQVLPTCPRSQSGLADGPQSPERSRLGPTLVTMTRSSGYGLSAVLISSLADRIEEK